MKKRSVLLNLLVFLICPLLLILIFTAISSLATRWYEYIPSALDGMIIFFSELAAYMLDITLFAILGAFLISVTQKRIGIAVLTGIIAVFQAGVLPILMYLVRSLFLFSVSDISVMAEYLTMDIITAESSLIKVLIGFIVCAAGLIFFKLTKRDAGFVRPYIVPGNISSVCAMIISASLVLSSIMMFVINGEYSIVSVVSLLIGIFVDIVIYFAFILGSYYEKHIFERIRC
ncbi:MAG: hypothetical protein ACI4QR_06335 [Eubacteriales bacterium]